VPEPPVSGAHSPRPEARCVPPAQGGSQGLTRPVEDGLPGEVRLLSRMLQRPTRGQPVQSIYRRSGLLLEI